MPVRLKPFAVPGNRFYLWLTRVVYGEFVKTSAMPATSMTRAWRGGPSTTTPMLNETASSSEGGCSLSGCEIAESSCNSVSSGWPTCSRGRHALSIKSTGSAGGDAARLRRPELAAALLGVRPA